MCEGVCVCVCVYMYVYVIRVNNTLCNQSCFSLNSAGFIRITKIN